MIDMVCRASPGEVEKRLERLEINDLDAVCKKIIQMVSDRSVVMDSTVRENLRTQYQNLYLEGTQREKRYHFIAETLKASVAQSGSRSKKLPEWAVCSETALEDYRQARQCPIPEIAHTKTYFQPMAYDDEAQLAIDLSRQGNHQAALQLREEVLHKRREIYPPESVEVLKAESNLATTYNRLGRYEEALALRRHVLEVRQKLYPTGHPDLLRAQANLATALSKMDADEDE